MHKPLIRATKGQFNPLHTLLLVWLDLWKAKWKPHFSAHATLEHTNLNIQGQHFQQQQNNYTPLPAAWHPSEVGVWQMVNQIVLSDSSWLKVSLVRNSPAASSERLNEVVILSKWPHSSSMQFPHVHGGTLVFLSHSFASNQSALLWRHFLFSKCQTYGGLWQSSFNIQHSPLGSFLGNIRFLLSLKLPDLSKNSRFCLNLIFIGKNLIFLRICLETIS